MPDEKDQYKSMLSEFIQKQMVIFGPNIVIDKTRKVPGLEVAADGVVLGIQGDSDLIIRSLVNEYNSLSTPITQRVFSDILKKYPGITLS